MKKWILLSIFVLWAKSGHALPVGNPSQPALLTQGLSCTSSSYNPWDPCFCWLDALSLRIGYYGDWVFNRNLEAASGFNEGAVIRQTEIITNAGILTLNIANKLDIFGTLGTSTLTLWANDDLWTTFSQSEGRYRWETYFSWSAGARATLFQWRNWAFGAEGQYFQTNPKVTEFMDVFDGRYNYFNENNRTIYREWQAALGLSYKIRPCCSDFKIVPYAAVKCSWSRWHVGDLVFIKTKSVFPYQLFSMKSHKLWGYAIGATAAYCDCASLTIEGRWADETALYLNIEFRF